jgi:predicted ribosome quality control (RQC) complex YloA/Tae2 family protein
MVSDAIEYCKELKKALEDLNTDIETRREIKIDTRQIKEEITKSLKRELAGRSSYGIGV